MQSPGRRAWTWWLVGIFSGVLLSGGVVGAQVVSSGVIHACVNDDGELRILGPGAACRRGESPLDWNIQGPPGPQGPAGPAGPVPSPAVYFADVPDSPSQGKIAVAFCPPGKVAVGGGGAVGDRQAQTFIEGSMPADANGNPIVTPGATPVAWRVVAQFDLVVINNWGLRAYVVCI